MVAPANVPQDANASAVKKTPTVFGGGIGLGCSCCMGDSRSSGIGFDHTQSSGASGPDVSACDVGRNAMLCNLASTRREQGPGTREVWNIGQTGKHGPLSHQVARAA